MKTILLIFAAVALFSCKKATEVKQQCFRCSFGYVNGVFYPDSIVCGIERNHQFFDPYGNAMSSTCVPIP